jgi:RHH-type proline utilization regulon transcriptional repressor/proline dehydrogenase/delta 1-pyrroline-5-carboxylate dehydrogenase
LPAVASLREFAKAWKGRVQFVTETDEQLAACIRDGKADRVRFASPDRVPLFVQQAANEAGGCVVSKPVSGEGRLEMLWYLREQSISADYHRYGNLGARAAEPRAAVL